MDLREIENEQNNFPEELNYSEDKWQDALAGIEAYEKRKRLRDGFTYGTVGAIFIGILIFIGFNQNDTKRNNKLDAAQTEQISNSDVEEATNKNLLSSKETTDDSDSIDNIDINEKSSIITSKDQSSHPSKEGLISTNNNPSTNINAQLKNPTSQIKSNEISKKYIDSNFQENVVKLDEEDIIEFNSENIMKSADSRESSEHIVSLDDYNIKETIATLVINPNDDVVSQITDRDVLSNKGNVEPNDQKNDNSAVSNEKTADLALENDILTKSDPIIDSSDIASNQDSSNDSEKIITEDDNRDVPTLLTFVDSTNESLDTSSFSIPSRIFAMKVFANPYAQFGRNDSWSKIDFGAGLEFENTLTHSWAYSVGLDYFYVSSLPQVIERSETSYALGYESVVSALTTDRLHMASLPVQISYRPHNKLQLGTGLGLNYVLWADNTLEKRKVTNFSSQLLSSDNTSGYIQGYERVHLFGLGSIEYWLNTKTSLGINYYQGFGDVTIDEEFRNTENDNNSRLEFNLKYIIK